MSTHQKEHFDGRVKVLTCFYFLFFCFNEQKKLLLRLEVTELRSQPFLHSCSFDPDVPFQNVKLFHFYVTSKQEQVLRRCTRAGGFRNIHRVK